MPPKPAVEAPLKPAEEAPPKPAVEAPPKPAEGAPPKLPPKPGRRELAPDDDGPKPRSAGIPWIVGLVAALAGAVAVIGINSFLGLGLGCGDVCRADEGRTVQEEAQSGGPPSSVVFAHVADARIGAADDTTSASNQAALAAVMRAIRAQPGAETPRFLVLSGAVLGDTSVAGEAPAPPPQGAPAVPPPSPAVQDTTPVPAAPAVQGAAAVPASTGGQAIGRWRDQADSLAAVLASSPVANVYLASARPLPAGFLARLRERLRRSGVGVQDLTACYDAAGVAPGACRTGVPGTRFVLVGYRSTPGADTSSGGSLERLGTLLSQTPRANQRAVVVAGSLPPGGGGRPASPEGEASGEPPDTASRWTRLIRPDDVAAVLGPADEASPDGEGKFRPAPPLGVADPGSAVARNGFALVRLGPGGATQRIVSHDRQTGMLSGESLAAAPAAEEQGAFRRLFEWLWSLPNNTRDLARATVLLLGLLFAFLTVAALWEVPGKTRMVTVQLAAMPAEGAANASPVQQVQQVQVPDSLPGGSVFQGNLARTVWSGLTGIAAVTLLTQFWQLSGIKAEALYVVMFGVSFLALLLTMAFIRAVAEGLRSRIASARLIPTWDPPARLEGQGAAMYWTAHRSRSWVTYWVHRAWRWLVSLRETLLVFVDTFVTVLMGQRYDANLVWEKRIVEDQRALLRMAHLLRDNIGEAVRGAVLGKTGRSGGCPELEKGIRVSISVLSDDGTTAFYISSSARSLDRRFGQKSLAWLAIYAREPRWWVDTYPEDSIIAFDNTVGALPGPTGPLMLADYFEPRFRSDYEAFIVVPLPWNRGDVAEGGRRGGLHISFEKADWFKALWPSLHDAGLPATPPPGDIYGASFDFLTDLQSETLLAVLEQALDMLGVVVSRFDQTIYESRIRGHNAG